MSRFPLLVFTLASTVLLAEPATEEQKIQKGSAVSSALVQKLSGELKQQIQTRGLVEALHFCTGNALILTDQVAKDSNTSVKRVSLNNRNPVNAATPEEAAVLHRWQSLQTSGQPLPPYEIKHLSNGESVYYKPILINNEACLKCHGEIAADSPLYQAIKTAYPEDKATGYKMGDLRGMIVVTLPKED
jgi:hypothetical protein